MTNSALFGSLMVVHIGRSGDPFQDRGTLRIWGQLVTGIELKE